MQDLGLTEYQARVYLTLLDLGVSKASQIPSLSRVPRTRIYSTMNQLHEKGLVEIIPESPIKYRPVRISDYLERLAESHMQIADDLMEKREKWESEFAIKGEVEVEERGGFEALYGRRNVRERLTRMYEEAESEILSIGTAQSPTRIVSSRLPTIEEKFRNGVEMKYAFPVNSSNRDNAQILSQYADVKNIDMDLSIYFLVVDSRQALLCHPIPPDESFLKGDDIAIWTNDKGIAEALRSIANSILNRGYDIEEVDLTTPLLDSARSYINLLGIRARPVFEALATSIGEELSKSFKSKDSLALMKELSAYWKENSLGEFKIAKRRPLTVAMSYFVKCRVRTPKGEHPFCRFVRSMIATIVERRLGPEIGIKKCKCLASKDGYCSMSFVVA